MLKTFFVTKNIYCTMKSNLTLCFRILIKHIFIYRKKFWKEVNHIISLQYLTILYQLHCLTTLSNNILVSTVITCHC
jgi:hypothetical protein